MRGSARLLDGSLSAAKPGRWQRVNLDGLLDIPAGDSSVSLHIAAADGKADFNAELHAVELIRPAVRSELARRALAQQLKARTVFANPDAVKHYLQLNLANKAHEVFAVLFLDVQNRLLALEELFRGTLTQTSVYPREVVLRALKHQAAAVVLAHNHPSGTVQPSRADEALTQTLKTTLALIDVRVLDHVIVAPGEALSMAERGLL